jgi:AbrB family looped-hinge helix DNA binding protein
MKRTFDAKLWKTGNAKVVTIPASIIKKFKLKEGDELEVTIKKGESKK